MADWASGLASGGGNTSVGSRGYGIKIWYGAIDKVSVCQCVSPSPKLTLERTVRFTCTQRHPPSAIPTDTVAGFKLAMGPSLIKYLYLGGPFFTALISGIRAKSR